MKFLRQRNKLVNEAENNAGNDDTTPTTQGEGDDGIQYPHGVKLALIMTSAYLSMFLVALVRTFPPLSIATTDVVFPSF